MNTRSATGFLAFLFLVVANIVTTADESAQPFRVGFARNLFTDVNDTDARASVKAWGLSITKEYGIRIDPTAHLFENPAEMISAMQRGEVDALSLLFSEYEELAARVELGPWFVTQIAKEVFEHYILLVHEDAGIIDPSSLQGSLLLLHNNGRMCLAPDWMDRLAMEHTFRNASVLFGEIRTVPKVTGAVLPVFFRKADACVVSESSFETVREMNPQLGLKLRVLAKSPPLLPAVMCFRKDFESPEKERLMQALRELHTTPAGKQVLTIFQAEALVEVTENVLKETMTFLAEIERMRERQNGKKQLYEGRQEP